VRPELFDHLLLLAAILCSIALVRALRRSEGGERARALVLGLLLVACVMAVGQSVFVGALALGATVLMVVLPSLLEQASRWAFARGRLAWTARLGIARAMLMPGSGLSRQIPILEGIGLVERRGVDAALAHFRRLADQAEDPVELALIHEQIVAMLFHGQRWDEGIAHYERRFHPGYAALRPSLALGLLRAYGESGRLDTAAGLLRALEDGPIGADSSTLELISQARLTFLAYAGAVAPLDELVEQQRFVDLGLSPATAELFRGIAQVRAGAPDAALVTLRKVEQLAGPRDTRVLAAARQTTAELGRRLRDAAGEVLPLELEPELRRYVELVTARLREFIAAPPTLRRNEKTWLTNGVIALAAMVYAIHVLRGRGSIGLLELGALVEDLWLRGSWPRVLTSAWIHVDLVGLLFDAYLLWLAGQLVERLLGPARMALASFGAAVAGLAVSVAALPWLQARGLDSLALVGATGGHLLAVGAGTAALVLLMPGRTPMLRPRARRNLVVTLSLLLAANLIMNWPGALGFGCSPLALLTCVAVGVLVALLPAVPRTGKQAPSALARASEVLVRVLVVGLALSGGVAAVLVVGESPEQTLLDHRMRTCELDGVALRVPSWYVEQAADAELPFALPIVDGMLDTLELRDGSLVQLAVVRSDAPAEQPRLDLAALSSSLSTSAPGSLPEPIAALLAASTEHHAFDVWRNGERVGRMLQRELAVPQGEAPAALVLLVTPADALDHAPALWLAILADARRVAAPTGLTRCDVGEP
jgi:membrane associated rhomboid family serine protease